MSLSAGQTSIAAVDVIGAGGTVTSGSCVAESAHAASGSVDGVCGAPTTGVASAGAGGIEVGRVEKSRTSAFSIAGNEIGSPAAGRAVGVSALGGGDGAGTTRSAAGIRAGLDEGAAAIFGSDARLTTTMRGFDGGLVAGICGVERGLVAGICGFEGDLVAGICGVERGLVAGMPGFDGDRVAGICGFEGDLVAGMSGFERGLVAGIRGVEGGFALSGFDNAILRTDGGLPTGAEGLAGGMFLFSSVTRGIAPGTGCARASIPSETLVSPDGGASLPDASPLSPIDEDSVPAVRAPRRSESMFGPGFDATSRGGVLRWRQHV